MPIDAERIQEMAMALVKQHHPDYSSLDSVRCELRAKGQLIIGIIIGEDDQEKYHIAHFEADNKTLCVRFINCENFIIGSRHLTFNNGATKP